MLAATILLGGCSQAETLIDSQAWQAYRKAYLSADGRVVDTGNGGISHSEGQGYAMLLAVAADDRQSFDKIWNWTRAHLASGNDHDKLFAWKWVPGAPGHLADTNNATDGDLLIAWALGRASRQFDEPAYGREASAIAQAIRMQLGKETEYGTLLLPGREGFEFKEGIVLNPSYLIFPAYRELAHWDDASFWQRLAHNSLIFLKSVMQHYDGVAPDWLLLSKKQLLKPPSAPLRFGYDALRIPIYVCWQHDEREIPLAGIAMQWHDSRAPAWRSLEEGTVAETPLSGAHLASRWLLSRCLPDTAWDQAPTIPDGELDYYSGTLRLLAQLAWADRQ